MLMSSTPLQELTHRSSPGGQISSGQDGLQLVINWHLTEVCNYSCKYCYAKWGKHDKRELIHDERSIGNLLSQLYEFFRPENRSNPLTREMNWNSVRLNFAGGDPLLYRKQTLFAVGFARDMGFDVSMISNGSYFGNSLMEELAPRLSMLGISVDSADAAVNLSIGRSDRQGRVLAVDDLIASIRAARNTNPGVRLKVNKVVNSLNDREDMSSLIQPLGVDKWKVLRMLPVVTTDLSVTDAQFRQFVERHARLGSVLHSENTADQTESYLMIDPHGRFFQNSVIHESGEYLYSRPILSAGIDEALVDMKFSAKKFVAHYSPNQRNLVAPSC